MKTYSIMTPDVEHLEEICEDIICQYKNGVTTMPLFGMSFVAEGIPFIDKASIFCEKYALFRDRLKIDGVPSGVLVQSTIGHGYKLNEMPDVQFYTNLTDGAVLNTQCPADERLKKHFYGQLATIASYEPDEIMIDDDLRLLGRAGMGCACPLHMKMVCDEYGKEISREELFHRISTLKTEEDKRLKEIFIKSQGDSLVEFCRVLRAGIDSVNPKIPGSYCGVGVNFEFAEEMAKVLAGEGNPVVVRVNNGNYTPVGARNLSNQMYRAAAQVEKVKGVADVILAETDTCPQNRYSTGTASLHAQFTVSILEGCSGAKHWITRLAEFEPDSGKAYRKKLSENTGFYNKLSEIVPTLSWLGARIPVSAERNFDFSRPKNIFMHANNWASCVLERLGLPFYYSSVNGGAAFLEEDLDRLFTDEQILNMLSGKLFLSSEAAESLIQRGFGEHIGVDVKPWNGANPSGELINNKGVNAQNKICELVPNNQSVRSDSMVYHLRGGKYKDLLFPGSTTYNNSLGGSVTVFSGVPASEFHYTKAFSFLNETRKKQMIGLLAESGNLPVYYPNDSEILLKAASMPSGELFVAYINISLDCDDKLYLVTDRPVSEISYLSNKGERLNCTFTEKDGVLVIDKDSKVLEPVILFIK